MRPYCEIIVLEWFPQIRALMAKELIDNLGFTQQEAAFKMDITQPAISQYRKEMRATKLKLIEQNPVILNSIKVAARTLANSKNPQNLCILCDICKEIRSLGILSVNQKESSDTQDDCKMCFDTSDNSDSSSK